MEGTNIGQREETQGQRSGAEREGRYNAQSRLPAQAPTWLRENPVRDKKEDECDMSSEGFSNKDFFTVPGGKKKGS